MKKHFAGLLAILVLGTLSWAQATKSPFDARKSRQELEIMKGILSTALSFAAQDSQKAAASSWRFSNINAFYLAGQGAVFTIPNSSLRISRTVLVAKPGDDPKHIVLSAPVQKELEAKLLEIEYQAQQVALQTQQLEQAKMSGQGSGTGKGIGSGIGSGVGKGTGKSELPAPPAPPATPAAPAAPAAPPPPPQPVKRETLLKRMEELKEKAEQTRKEAEADREKFLKNLAELKGDLLETLANYGDSLTTVKPDEYINLVLMTDDFGGGIVLDSASQRTGYEVISAQKSWITDYKAGRLSLDAFKQKVLQYSE